MTIATIDCAPEKETTPAVKNVERLASTRSRGARPMTNAGNPEPDERGQPEYYERDIDCEEIFGRAQVRGNIGVEGVVGEHPGKYDQQDHRHAGDGEDLEHGDLGFSPLARGIGDEHPR